MLRLLPFPYSFRVMERTAYFVAFGVTSAGMGLFAYTTVKKLSPDTLPATLFPEVNPAFGFSLAAAVLLLFMVAYLVALRFYAIKIAYRTVLSRTFRLHLGALKVQNSFPSVLLNAWRMSLGIRPDILTPASAFFAFVPREIANVLRGIAGLRIGKTAGEPASARVTARR
jgi:hypothetical protein